MAPPVELGGVGDGLPARGDSAPPLEAPATGHQGAQPELPVDHVSAAESAGGGAAPALEAAERPVGAGPNPEDTQDRMDRTERLEAADAQVGKTIDGASSELGVDRGSWLRGVSYEPLGSNVCGEYDPDPCTLVINRDLAAAGPSEELERTAAHETFHAYQNQEVWKMENGLPHDTRAPDWAADYLDPSDFGVTFEEYRTQALEADAFDFEETYLNRARLL